MVHVELIAKQDPGQVFISPRPTVDGFIASGILTTIGLLFVGGVKTWATRGNWATSAFENLAIAVGGGIIAYLIGELFAKMVNKET
jgi:VIT1/CCC1 family predicted Fe2+/Mn2+ transporter